MMRRMPEQARSPSFRLRLYRHRRPLRAVAVVALVGDLFVAVLGADVGGASSRPWAWTAVVAAVTALLGLARLVHDVEREGRAPGDRQ